MPALSAVAPRNVWSEATEEGQQRIGDVVGPFLLRPVAAAWQDLRLPQLWHHLRQCRDHLVCAGKRQYQVAITDNIQGRDSYPGADERREQFPIPVDVAVPVQAASKTGARELASVEG